MELKAISLISHPRQKVYLVFRDKIQKLIPFMENVEKFLEIEREELPDHKVKIINEWYATAPVPSIARSFISPKMLGWKDYALWHNDQFYCEWRLESFFMKDFINCKGKTTFTSEGDSATKVEIQGELIINTSIVPGIPIFLRKQIGPMIEKFIVNLISPNLSNTAKAAQEYLDTIKNKG